MMKKFSFQFAVVLFLFYIFGEILLSSEFSFVIKKDRTVVLNEGDNPIWQYNAELLLNPKVPEDDPRKLASCYIHPLYGVNGEVLTDDAPKDHYHHHGVFWTWPHVRVHRTQNEAEHYSTWMGQSRMKPLFVRFHDFRVDNEKAVFKLENGWFIGSEINEFEWDDEKNPISEKVVEEHVTITTYPVIEEGGMRSRVIDLDFQWVIGEFPMSLQGSDGKSYGGLTVRFRPSPSRPGAASAITVPDGVAKEDLPEKPLPWADYTSRFQLDEHGKVSSKRSGATIFVPKSHPDYPPTWLTRYYGALCVGWPGVEERTFQPGQRIKLSYRLWIHGKEVDVRDIEKAYDSYTKIQK